MGLQCLIQPQTLTGFLRFLIDRAEVKLSHVSSCQARGDWNGCQRAEDEAEFLLRAVFSYKFPIGSFEYSAKNPTAMITLLRESLNG